MEKQNKPAYQTIYDTIKQQIIEEQYLGGDMLPSEAELEKMFKVSRTPVRSALKQLENDKFIYRIQGKGSFVSNQQPKGFWTNMSGFRNFYSNDWEKISVRTIEVKKVRNAEYASLLLLPADTELIYLKRIRYLNNEPMFFLEHYVRPVLPIECYEENLAISSVQQLLKEKIGMEIVEVTDEIEAQIANPYIAGALQLPDFSAILKGTRISYIANQVPVDLNMFHINTEKWKYYSHFKYE